jgi:membrane protease subunit (stomatin/prohibitin family)
VGFIMDFVKGQLIEVIEWMDDTNDTLVHRFPDNDNEIKNGAQLIVRPGQACVFVHEGEIGDVFGPGKYSLTTSNIPVLTTLKSWKYGFNSPFKCEVYFVNTRQYADMKWGTKQPIMLRDPDFGAVRIRAFGTYSIRIADPKKFMEEMTGTDGKVYTDEIEDTLKSRLVSAFTHVVGASKIAALDLAGNYMDIATKAQGAMSLEFTGLGIELVKFIVENVSLPPKLEKALDTRGEMGILGNMQQYQQFQAANAMMAAANNQGAAGGMVGAGMGFGAGMMMGNHMGNAFAGPGMGGPPPMMGGGGPPPLQQQMIYANINGQQAQVQGPQFQQMVAAGQVTKDTMVWMNGMAGWQPAGQVPQLSGLFAAPPAGGPPPMPGGGGPPPMDG